MGDGCMPCDLIAVGKKAFLVLFLPTGTSVIWLLKARSERSNDFVSSREEQGRVSIRAMGDWGEI